MVTWWKDRDKWLPGPDPDQPPKRFDHEDQPELPLEDAGDVADDNSDEFDDVTPSDRDVDD